MNALARLRPLATIAAAIATLTASLSVVPLFDSGRWVIPTVISILLMAFVGAASRAVGLPPPLQPILQLLALLTLLTVMFAQPEAAFGFLPGPVAIAELQDLTREALVEADVAVAPVPTSELLILLSVGGIGLVALTVDTIGVTLRLPALAGLPLLLVFALPAAVVRGGVPWWLLPLAVIGWLLLLAADARDEARSWGPLLTKRTASGAGPRSHPRTARPRVSSGVAAVQVAVVAVLAALLLPTVIPGLSEPVWVTSPGNRPGIDGPGAVSIDPFASLRRNLVENPEREVLRFRTSSETPDYLRLISLDTFDGVTWRASPAAQRLPASEPLGAPDLPAVERIVPQTYDVSIGDLDNAQLPIPYAATSITGLGDIERWTWDPATRTVEGNGASSLGATYQVASYDVEPTRAELRAATKRAPDPLLAFLRLPADLTPELARIAEEVTAGAQTPYARAQALVEHFTKSGGYSYSTNVVTPEGADPLQSFLEERIGYCQQFAGTMALMARVVGIPSRVVIGFTTGRANDDGEYVVQARNAHAWPELWFAGAGWVRFEPTPRVGAGVVQPDYSRERNDQSAPDEQRPDDVPVPDRQQDAAAAPGGAQGGLPPLVLIAGLLAIVVLLAAPSVIVAVRRRRRTSLPDPRQRIEATWRDLGQSITDLGWTWSGASTPRDAANSLARQFRLGEPERAAMKRLVWWIEQVRYAPPTVPVTPPTPAELRADLALLRRTADRAAVRTRRLRARLVPASLLGGGLRESTVETARENARV